MKSATSAREMALGTASSSAVFLYFPWAAPLVNRVGLAMTYSRPLYSVIRSCTS